MKMSILPTFKQKPEVTETRFWSSNRDWRSPKDSHSIRAPWSTMYEDYASHIPKIFLGKIRSLSALERSPHWIARDGLIPFLSFLSRFPKPEKGFRSKLYIHENWLRFIPAVWQKFCGSYTVGFSPDSELFDKPLLLEKRNRWITSSYVSPEFCSIEYLEIAMTALRSNAGLIKLRQRPLLGFFEIGSRSPNYLFPFQRILSANLRGAFATVDYGTMKHYSDFRDAVIIDINERMLCSDDSNIHMMLARGAMLPEQARRKGLFERLSSFHGYFISELPADLSSFHGNSFFGRYLQPAPLEGASFGVLPFGPVPRWILSLAESKFWLQEKISFKS